MQRADIVIATTGVRGLIKPEWVRPGQVILALSNPDPEIRTLWWRGNGALQLRRRRQGKSTTYSRVPRVV